MEGGWSLPNIKKGCRKVPGNYRPVSLISVICKLFKGFIKDKHFDHMVILTCLWNILVWNSEGSEKTWSSNTRFAGVYMIQRQRTLLSIVSQRLPRPDLTLTNFLRLGEITTKFQYTSLTELWFCGMACLMKLWQQNQLTLSKTGLTPTSKNICSPLV